MPYYNDLRPEDDFTQRDYELVFPQLQKQKVVKKRTINKLLELKRGLDHSIAPRRAEENLIIASWNIKEFGHTTQRLPESYFYIAEILSYFDLIAVQEIKSTLDDLHIILRLLGDDWGYLVNDITEGDAGNSERSCYIFNKKRVQLAGLAGEIVLWDELTQNSTIKQLKRTPYITGFTAGWKTFALLNVHLHPGDECQRHRVQEGGGFLVASGVSRKTDPKTVYGVRTSSLSAISTSITELTKDNPTIEMIHNAGYREVESLVGVDTNASQTEVYDRLFLTRGEYFSLGQSTDGHGKWRRIQPIQLRL